MYIIGLNGSPNKNGGTAFLINTVLNKCSEEGAEVEIINVSEALSSAKFPFCIVCSNPCNATCYSGTALEEAFDKLKKADAVVMGSPVYFGTISAQLKAFFDKTRKIRGEKALIGKPCGCVSTGASRFGGQETTLKAMHTMALVQGMTVVGSGNEEFDCGHHGVCAVRPPEKDEFAISRCYSMAKRLVNEVKK